MPGEFLDASVAVVGAGPAGARAAELLARAGTRVLLLDPKAPWEKPCGGGLTECAFETMPELHELEPRMRPIRRARLELNSERGFQIPLEKPIRIVSRRVLSDWQLLRAKDAGAVHVADRVRSIRRFEERWRLETGERTVLADLLVGADGAASRVRRAVAPRFEVELAPTRVAFAPGSRPMDEAMLLRFYPGVIGYAWDFPRPDHRSVGIVMQSGSWRRPLMDGEIDEFRQSEEACRCAEDGTVRAGAVIGTSQLGHGDFSAIGGKDFALLGDAAGLADPATGEGIRNALHSSALLAQAWSARGTFETYPLLARRSFEREFAAGRILRRVLFESELGAGLVDTSIESDTVRSFVATLVGAINEHDGSLARFGRRWWRLWSAMRLEPPECRRPARVAIGS